MVSDLLRETAEATPLANVRHPARVASAPLTEVLSELRQQVSTFECFSFTDAVHELGLSMFQIHAALRELKAAGMVVLDDVFGWLPMESN